MPHQKNWRKCALPWKRKGTAPATTGATAISSAGELARLEASGREYVVRFKMPLTGQTAVPDLLRGDVMLDNSQFTDYVLLKSNGLPTYHLAHVVDDHFMQISHIPGVEWLNTAPIHVNLFKAFGWEMPVFVHLPVILNPSGKGKLSKRHQAFTEDGAEILVRADEFMQGGYLPKAVLNFLANIGWTFGDDVEKFTMDEAIARFDLATVSPAPTKLPYSKLDWLNGQYIQEMEPLELARAVRPVSRSRRSGGKRRGFAGGYATDARAPQAVYRRHRLFALFGRRDAPYQKTPKRSRTNSCR